MAYDQNNIFARILRKEIPSKVVYENDKVFAFEDIDGKAPIHILIIPKADVETVHDLTNEHDAYITAMFAAAREIAQEKGIAQEGYRLVINCRERAGQSVFHLHMHLLGGRDMQWPPG